MRTINIVAIVLIFVFLLSCSDDNGSPSAPENKSPVLSDIDDYVVFNGQTVNVDLFATDEDGDDLSFSIPDNPGFLSITDFDQIGDTATATLVISVGENPAGTFNVAVNVSDGKGGSDRETFTIEVKEQTKLFLRSNDEDFLSEEQTPSDPGSYTTIRFYFYSNTIREFSAVINDGLESGAYTFTLWLGASSPQGTFSVYLLLDHNGAKKTLAFTTFNVPYDQYFQRFTKTMNGQGGGTAGDKIILRVTYSGSYPGQLLFGSNEFSDSHILIPADITVSVPKFSGTLTKSDEAESVISSFESDNGPYKLSNSVNNENK
jgi:hypothetical protein